MEPDGVDTLRADVRAKMDDYVRRPAESPAARGGDWARFEREFRTAFLAALAAAFATADVHGYCVQVHIRDMCAEMGTVCGVADNDCRRPLAHYVVKCEMSPMNCGYNIAVFEVECYSC